MSMFNVWKVLAIVAIIEHGIGVATTDWRLLASAAIIAVLAHSAANMACEAERR